MTPVEHMIRLLSAMKKTEIRLIPGESRRDLPVGTSKLLGLPDVPPSFVWPRFEGEDPNHVRADRPLRFLCQIDLSVLASLGVDDPLPDTGILSFFYDTGSMRGGVDPADEGCSRVYWFPDRDELSPRVPPEDLPDLGFRGALPLEFVPHDSYPAYDDFCEYPEENEILPTIPPGTLWEVYADAVSALGYGDDGDLRHKLLGWPDTEGEAMPYQCEAVSRGIYMGDGSGMDRLTREERIGIAETGRDEWISLLQLDSIEDGNTALIWEDPDSADELKPEWIPCGRLWFFIRKADLAARRFEGVWLIFQ